jgi:hypothetical protein
MTRWWVSFHGPVTPEVRAALERTRLDLTGLGHSVGRQESHSVFVDAPSDSEAVATVRAALAGLPVTVDPEARQLADA